MFEETGLYISIGTLLGVLSGFWKVYTWTTTKMKERDKEIAAVQTQLADFKLYAVEKFATQEHVTGAVDRVTNAVDKAVNRIDSFVVEFNRTMREQRRD